MSSLIHSQRARIAAAVAGALTLGTMATPAGAAVYAGSRLLLQNLSIGIFDGAPGANPVFTAANSFSFTATNTAFLNGNGDAKNATCAGVPGIPGTPPGNNTCGVSPALDAAPANAPGGTAVRANNNFSFFGPGGDQYANSDSIIQSAQLTFDPSTATRQIAEAELETGLSASANAEIQSQTGLTFSFTLSATGSLVLAFQADPDLLAEISPGTAFPAGAQANMNWQFTLTKTGTAIPPVAVWAPTGSAASDCATNIAGVTCTEDNDGADLNRSISLATVGSAPYLRDDGVFYNFGITLLNLPTGTYSLSLNEVTSVNVFQAVPLPGALSLMGLGLVGLGLVRRRKAA